MGRFNLNQILSDTSKAAAGGGSAKPRPSESRYEKLSVFDLVPSEDNFYSMREIGELEYEPRAEVTNVTFEAGETPGLLVPVLEVNIVDNEE